MNLLEKIFKLEKDILELNEVKRQNLSDFRTQEINDTIRLKREFIKQNVPLLSAKECQNYALSKIDCTAGGQSLLDAINAIDNEH